LGGRNVACERVQSFQLPPYPGLFAAHFADGERRLQAMVSSGFDRHGSPRPGPLLPGLERRAKPSIAKAVRIGGAILFPRQQARRAAAAQLLLDISPIRCRAPVALRGSRRRRKQQQFKALVVQALRQRSGQPRKAGATHITVHDPPLLTPNVRAMTRSVRPWCLKRRTSRIRRIDNLSVGIGLPRWLNEKSVARLSCRSKRPAPPNVAHDRLKSPLTMR